MTGPSTAMWWLGQGRDAKMLTPTHPCHLWWARELTLPFTSCSTWESGPCTSQGSTVELTLLMEVQENMSMGNLTPPLICRNVVWVGKKCPLPPAPHHLWQVGKLAWSHESEKLSLALTNYSTQESGPSTSLPGQLSRPDTEGVGAEGLILRA